MLQLGRASEKAQQEELKRTVAWLKGEVDDKSSAGQSAEEAWAHTLPIHAMLGMIVYGGHRGLASGIQTHNVLLGILSLHALELGHRKHTELCPLHVEHCMSPCRSDAIGRTRCTPASKICLRYQALMSACM